jgi:signal transduction histidine kinase
MKKTFSYTDDITAKAKNHDKIAIAFFSYASHELRTPYSHHGICHPLSATSGSDDRGIKIIKVIHKESEKLSHVLKYLKISSWRTRKSPSSEPSMSLRNPELMDFHQFE